MNIKKYQADVETTQYDIEHNGVVYYGWHFKGSDFFSEDLEVNAKTYPEFIKLINNKLRMEKVV
jgi:hypothetical protein